jgi:hypothetical protein
LRSPVRDAYELADVLAQSDIGRFAVKSVLDEPVDEVRRAIDSFLTSRDSEDLVVIYLSCHGVRDSHGRLHFAARDTRTDQLASTSIDSRWLMEQLEECRARRQVVILDCCFSGAFAGSVRAESGVNVVDPELREHLIGHGRGRAVLTATRAYEYSFDGEPLPGGLVAGSVFTSGLVDGLRSGKADANQDGLVSVEEAYAFAYDYVLKHGTGQTPQRWLYGAEGAIWLAGNPFAAAVPLAVLPDSMAEALRSPYAEIRLGAVITLGQWLNSGDASLAMVAVQELKRIAATEDVPRIAVAARELLNPATTPRPLHVIVTHRGWVRAVAFNPADGIELASAGDDAEIRMWQPPAGVTRTLGPHPDWIEDIAFSPDGSRIAAAIADGQTFVWQPEAGQYVVVAGHRGPVHAVAYSPDGIRLATSGADMTVRVLGTGPATVLAGHRDAVYSVAFGPDGQQLASASGDSEVRVWDLATGRTAQTLTAHKATVWTVAFSPDGSLLASAGDDGEIRLWHLPHGTVSHVLVGHIGPVYKIAFSPDGETLASAGEDGIVRLWNPHNGQLVHALGGHTGWLRALAFSRDGSLLASSGKDKSVRVWGLSGQSRAEHM